MCGIVGYVGKQQCADILVNALKIKSVKKDSAELINGVTLPVSKSRATAVKEAYLWAKR